MPKFQLVCTELRNKYAVFTGRLNLRLNLTYRSPAPSSVQRNNLANSMDLPPVNTNDSCFSSALNLPPGSKMTKSNSGEIVLTRLEAFSI